MEKELIDLYAMRFWFAQTEKRCKELLQDFLKEYKSINSVNPNELEAIRQHEQNKKFCGCQFPEIIEIRTDGYMYCGKCKREYRAK